MKNLNRSGEHFISGGEDREVKIWQYNEGSCKYVGFGHSNTINKVTKNIYILNILIQLIISPNNEFIVSVGSDGAIFLWETPLEIRLGGLEEQEN